MTTVKILTKPLREGKSCEISISGTKTVTVSITIKGKVVATREVTPPAIIELTLPAGSAGSSLRVSAPGDFDSGYILAP